MKKRPELISFSDFLMIAPFYDIRSFFRPEIEFLKGGNEALQISGLIKEDQNELIEYHDKVAVLTIEGPLRPGRDWYYSTGYGDIQDAIDELLEKQNITTVIQKIDSPGGTVKEAFETEDKFKELAEKKNLISLITGSATSAAALMTFPAHERYLASKTAQTGSIGVVAEHVDDREWFKIWGEVRTSVASGKFKDAGTNTRGFDAKAKEVFESSVLKLKSIFVDSAAKGLNKPIAEIEAQESRVYIGQDGIDQGFADGFASLNELIETHNNSTLFMPGRPAFSNIHTETRMDINQFKADHPDVYQAAIEQGKQLGMEAGKEKFTAEGRSTGQLLERKRISEIKALALPGQEKLTAEMIEDGTASGEAAGKFLGDQKAKLELQRANIETDLNDPLASDSPDMPKKPEGETAKDPTVEYEAAVLKAQDGGKVSRGQAMKAVKGSNPELHQKFIDAQNQGGK